MKSEGENGALFRLVRLKGENGEIFRFRIVSVFEPSPAQET